MKNGKIYKILILTFFFIINFSNFSFASCDFKIKIGQNISKIKKFIDFNSSENNEQTNKELINYFISSKDICLGLFPNKTSATFIISREASTGNGAKPFFKSSSDAVPVPQPRSSTFPSPSIIFIKISKFASLSSFDINFSISDEKQLSAENTCQIIFNN